MSAWLTIVGLGEGGATAISSATLELLAAADSILGPERLLALLTSSLALPSGARLSPMDLIINSIRQSTPSPLRGGIKGRGLLAPISRLSHPLPASPVKGEVPDREWGSISPNSTAVALPLEVGNAASAPRLIPWQSSLDAMLAQVDALRGRPTVILATGDPLWFGIGATLAKRYPADEMTIHPHPSAFQLAAARLRWPLQHAATLSLHGRAPATIHAHLLPGNRILALTGDGKTAAAVADILVDRGYGRSVMTMLEHLGAADERITSIDAESFDGAELGDFYVLAIDCVAGEAAPLLPPVPGLPDDAFVSDGQLTKREVRAATLAKLAPYPGGLLWDIGAGCGSVAIEWLRAARDGRAIAFEREPARLAMIATNAAALGTPTLHSVAGEAPASFAGQAMPDAIFLGGDVGNGAVFEAAWAALRPGGRLVANAVTVDGEQALYARREQFGGEVSRIAVSVLDTIGGHRVLRPRMAVTQWLVIKP